MLPTWTAAALELDFQVPLWQRVPLVDRWQRQDGNRDNRRLLSSASLCWWHALDNVLSRFVFERFPHAWPTALEDSVTVLVIQDGTLQPASLGVADVSRQEFADKDFRIGPAFAKLDFDDQFCQPVKDTPARLLSFPMAGSS